MQGPKILLFLFSLLFMAAFDQSVFAAEQLCTCYCAIPNQGATPVSGAPPMTAADCGAKCQEAGYAVAACSANSASFPGENLRCFDETTCQNQGGELDTKYQPAECVSGQHYCYPSAETLEKNEVLLQVPIGALTSTGDIGEYVNTAYKWMIGSGILIAIVFVMVGGLQYALGAASPQQVDKGKKRMWSAVIGFVLLLSAYLILYTVNPELVQLEVPQLPMVKALGLAGGDSCEYLTGQWGGNPYLSKYGAPKDSPYSDGQPAPKGGTRYTIEKADKIECGGIGQVSKDWEGNAVVEGTTCQYEYCPKPTSPDQTTRCVGRGENAQCLKCVDIVPDNSTGVQPSSSICAALEPSDSYKEGSTKLEVGRYCFYTQDLSMIVSGWDATADAAAITAAAAVSGTGALVVGGLITADIIADATTGTCAYMEINCNAMTRCEDYDTKVKAKNVITDDKLEDLEPGLLSGSVNIQSICQDDPCRFGNCRFDDTDELYDDCVTGTPSTSTPAEEPAFPQDGF